MAHGTLTFKYIWTNHLSKNNKGCALVDTKQQMTIAKATTQQLQVRILVVHACQPPHLCSFAM